MIAHSEWVVEGNPPILSSVWTQCLVTEDVVAVLNVEWNTFDPHEEDSSWGYIPPQNIPHPNINNAGVQIFENETDNIPRGGYLRRELSN